MLDNFNCTLRSFDGLGSPDFFLAGFGLAFGLGGCCGCVGGTVTTASFSFSESVSCLMTFTSAFSVVTCNCSIGGVLRISISMGVSSSISSAGQSLSRVYSICEPTWVRACKPVVNFRDTGFISAAALRVGAAATEFGPNAGCDRKKHCVKFVAYTERSKSW